MIIPSPLITLDYNPAKDILVVEWPDMQSYNTLEVNHSLQDIINTLKFYDVKHLLINARNSIIGIGKEEYAKIAADFWRSLLSTRLQKVARIQSNNKIREAQVREITQSKPPIVFQNFPSTGEAFAWLEAEN